MPDFGLWSILKGEKELPSPDSKDNTLDMSFRPKGEKVTNPISFPSPSKFDPNTAGVFTELDALESYNWGYLDDLYVNYEFAKGIMESKTNATYDVFIQILNGLSSACNNMWQFEIERHYCDEYNSFGEKTGKRFEQLVIVDKALSCPSPKAEPLVMALGGEQSVFLDASLQSDIPGSMMGTVTMKKSSR